MKNSGAGLTLTVLLAVSAALSGCGGRGGVDLSHDYDHATSRLADANYEPSWDGSAAFPEIVQQVGGSCQSYETTAMAEYIAWHETGKVTNLSEKFTAYWLLRTEIDDFVDPKTGQYEEIPYLGSGDDAFMIDVLTTHGVMPDVYYPFGDKNDASVQSDQDLMKKIFSRDAEKKYTHDEYVALLDQVMLTSPPTRFLHRIDSVDWSTGKAKESELRSPEELRDFLGIKRERFHLAFNSDLNSTYFPRKPEHVKAMFEQLAQHTDEKHISHELADKDHIENLIIESLERRMVVGLSADVWVGDWNSKLLFEGGGGHGMVIVGYQRQGTKVFFKIRNSWGRSIGMDGYNLVEDKILLPNVYWIKLYR